MKILIILTLLTFSLFSADNSTKPKDPKTMLDGITKHAIKIGSGTQKEAYIFIDPLCPFSQKLLTTIINNEELQNENTYYIFLYRLETFDSDNLIWYIFDSDDQFSNLEEVMIYHGIINEKITPSDQTLQALKEIAEVGKNLDITIRPYTISFDKGSKYCKVSSGTATCEEETW